MVIGVPLSPKQRIDALNGVFGGSSFVDQQPPLGGRNLDLDVVIHPEPVSKGFGDVQRGYLLNLRVKVPSAQIPVWRCSHIRQLTGATLTAESPDVNVLKRGRETPDQSRRLTTRRAVARANGLIAEIPPSVELVAGYSECQAFPSPTRWPVLVRKELGSARIRLPAEVEGGNSE